LGWAGQDGKPFPFAPYHSDYAGSTYEGIRALPESLPMGTPTIFVGWIRIKKEKEDRG